MISIEPLSIKLISEVEQIIDDNYAETAHFDIPLDIDWDSYLSFEDAFVAFVLRDKGEVVGILFFIVAHYPHIKELLMMQQVTFYVKPDYRKHSLKMIKVSETYAEQNGIDLIIQSARFDSSFCKVLEKKDYEPADVTYVKRIK